MHEFLACPPVFCESPGWRCLSSYTHHLGCKGFVEEFMEGPTVFMPEAENCILCSLPFGLPILGQVFLLLFVSVLTQFSGKRCVCGCSPNTAFCHVPRQAIFLLIVVTVLLQICAALRTRTHCPPHLVLLQLSGCCLLSVEIKPHSFRWLPVGLCRAETPAVIAGGCPSRDNPALVFPVCRCFFVFCVVDDKGWKIGPRDLTRHSF